MRTDYKAVKKPESTPYGSFTATMYLSEQKRSVMGVVTFRLPMPMKKMFDAVDVGAETLMRFGHDGLKQQFPGVEVLKSSSLPVEGGLRMDAQFSMTARDRSPESRLFARWTLHDREYHAFFLLVRKADKDRFPEKVASLRSEFFDSITRKR